ncbi:MAG: nitroreductase family protein [Patescibacteria group bacterium]
MTDPYKVYKVHKVITTDQIIDIKKPKLEADIIDLLKKRFSPRVFSDEKVGDDNINSLIEAARWTPSSSNRQPWFFYISQRDSQSFQKILACLSEGNYWAKNASHLIVGCYLDVDEKGKNNYAQYDLGQAVMSLIFQAQSLGYYAHQMGGFNKDLVKESLIIKPPRYPWVVIAIGKIGDYLKTDQILIDKDNKERKRKEVISQKI